MSTQIVLKIFLFAVLLVRPVLGFADIKEEYYPSGKRKAVWNYKEDKLDGISKEYYESGKLKAEGYFKENKPQGVNKEYYESGQLKYEISYQDGKQIAVKEYDESGRLKKTQANPYRQQ